MPDTVALRSAPPADWPFYLKPVELAYIARCSKRAVLDAIRRGELKALRRNARTLLVKKPDALAWLGGGATGRSR